MARQARWLVKSSALGLVSLALQGAGSVTVGLLRYQAPGTITVSAPAYQARSAGRTVQLAGATEVVARGRVVELRSHGKVVLSGPRLQLVGPAPFLLTPPGRRYAGTLAITAKGALLPNLSLPLEAYVAATTGDEMPADWPAAALTAQALASRSYAEALPGRHAADGYDFCDLTHCQLFRGLAAQDARVTAAAAVTRGKVLGWHGTAIAALWHSTCGGRLAANDEVFGGERLPYLPGHPDRDAAGRPWCADSPHAHPWRVAYGGEAVTKALRTAKVLGAAEVLRGIQVTDTGDVALAVRVSGARTHALTGYALWMALGPSFGWGEIKSPRFTVAREGARYTFQGEGLGHLVGMCQWGARGRALAGQGWEAIARAYFPGATIIAGTRTPRRPADRPRPGP
ncbi:MAG: Stage sporulation protein [Cyanobacteria bacterium RYN_339]|nr:Stage sporulation protein [Cyanobacteria bacterium RYN_339]